MVTYGEAWWLALCCRWRCGSRTAEWSIKDKRSLRDRRPSRISSRWRMTGTWTVPCRPMRAATAWSDERATIAAMTTETICVVLPTKLHRKPWTAAWNVITTNPGAPAARTGWWWKPREPRMLWSWPCCQDERDSPMHDGQTCPIWQILSNARR